MPRLALCDLDLRDDSIDWDEFANAIRSDADPRESKRPPEDDEWEDEDDGDDENY
jgi:hypothetical protein